jgi:hypothetical protein
MTGIAAFNHHLQGCQSLSLRDMGLGVFLFGGPTDVEMAQISFSALQEKLEFLRV